MQNKVSVRIHIDTVAKVKEFVRTISEQPLETELRSGRFVVDAKSIMGIFSLNISEPVELVLHGNEEDVDAALEKLEAFIAA